MNIDKENTIKFKIGTTYEIKCSNPKCSINSKPMLYEISNDKEMISYCPNCSISQLPVVPIEPSTDIRCEICDDKGYSIDTRDTKFRLCNRHTIDLFRHQLSKESFFKLYEINKKEYLLHDDFYCEISGECIQPVEEGGSYE